MKQHPLADALSAWVGHTLTYYTSLLSVKSVRLLLACLSVLVCLTCIVTARADIPSSIAKWVVGDVIQDEYIVGPDASRHYQFIRQEDSVDSQYRFELNMPQTLQEYIEEISLYKMEDGLQQAMGGEFIKQDEITIWTESENSEAIDKVGQFIESRPPKVVVD